jgi:protoporphyrinogen oxidase
MHEPAQIPTLILGAGLTGLSCAHHLGDGSRYRLIERDPDQVGGLVKTRSRPHGFLCDGTGHWLHLRFDDMKKLVGDLLGDNLAPRERRARIFSKGTFTHYPFQANTFGLPKEVIAECLTGLIKARYETPPGPPPKNYKEWIEREFGEGISKHFMLPYNRKIYGVPLDTLAADFAAKYIPRPSVEAVIQGALGLSKEALGYNATFVYPKRGGIGALAEALHARLPRKAERGREPSAIDLSTRTATMKDGEKIRFERLVNTIPLPDLVRIAREGDPSRVPAEVSLAAGKLRANSVLYFDVAIKGAPKEHQNYHWIYYPEDEFPFYRLGSYSAVEPSLAPAGHRSYYAELGFDGTIDPKRAEQPLLDGLRRAGILEDERDLVFAIPNVLSPAYVLFDHQYEAARKTVLDWANAAGIVSVGRYGRWQYNAMEDALMEGREAARTVSEGRA